VVSIFYLSISFYLRRLRLGEEKKKIDYLHGTPVLGVSKLCGVEQRALSIFGRAAITSAHILVNDWFTAKRPLFS